MGESDKVAMIYHLLCAADEALTPLLEAFGIEDEDDKAEEVESEDLEPRANHLRLGVGTFVSWDSNGERSRGRIEKVAAAGSVTSSDGFTLEGTKENPAFLIRLFTRSGSGWLPTETTVVHNAEIGPFVRILTVIGALAAPRCAEDVDMLQERKAAIRTAERVTMDTEIRAVETTDGSLRIAGYAAMFNREATGLSFREQIAPGAFKRSLASEQPVYLLINHDTDQLPLASTGSGTMRLSEDNVGLRMEADLDDSNPNAAALASALKRGDVTKMSFAFSINPGGETRAEDGLRTLTDVTLYEVSAVTWPAYESSSIGMRTAEQEADDAVALERERLRLRMAHLSLRK